MKRDVAKLKSPIPKLQSLHSNNYSTKFILELEWEFHKWAQYGNKPFKGKLKGIGGDSLLNGGY